MNQRRYPRLRVCFPLHIDAAKKPKRLGVTRNVSASGMLLATRSRFALGQRLALTFRAQPDSPERKLTARVVRLGRAGLQSDDLYPRRVAVEFETPFPALVHEFHLASQRQADLYRLA